MTHDRKNAANCGLPFKSKGKNGRARGMSEKRIPRAWAAAWGNDSWDSRGRRPGGVGGSMTVTHLPSKWAPNIREGTHRWEAAINDKYAALALEQGVGRRNRVERSCEWENTSTEWAKPTPKIRVWSFRSSKNARAEKNQLGEEKSWWRQRITLKNI
jgi:hypothetical protein